MPKIQIPAKLRPILTTKKRLVAVIGGRSSAKSESIGRILLMRCQIEGADILCGREFQNSIDDSVHKLLRSLIEKLGINGFDVKDKKINCLTGGGFRFRGFSRNSDAVKSAQDFKYSWIEEAQSLSQQSIDDLLPTIRATGSQLFFTANPQSSADPFSQRFIVPFLNDLLKHGFYEDDMHLVIVANWRDNPWHGELEAQRLWDKKHLPRARYDWIWEGAFNDEVEDSIIKTEWFDAAIDAHEKLGFKPSGAIVVSHDPSDSGPDDKGLVIRRGSVVLEAESRAFGDAEDGMDWALTRAIEVNADVFTWDCDGLGVSLKRIVNTALKGKRIEIHMFHGSGEVEHKNQVYRPLGVGSNIRGEKEKKNKDVFLNKRGQYYWRLREKFIATYNAVEKNQWIDPEEMISISSGVTDIRVLRSEVCRVPRKFNSLGKIQIMSKEDMKKLKIKSPNLGDSLMMAQVLPKLVEENDEPMVFETYF